MSVLGEKVRKALYAKLAGAVGAGKASAVYFKTAPETAVYPFIVFDRVPLTVVWAMNNSAQGERDRWFIKCLSDEDASGTTYAGALNEEILAAAEAAIGNSLSISGGTVSRCQRVADIPPIITDAADRVIFQNGFQLETFAS